jgi:hypothetical protein
LAANVSVDPVGAREWPGEDSLRYAMLAATIGSPVSVFGFAIDIATREAVAVAAASNG